MQKTLNTDKIKNDSKAAEEKAAIILLKGIGIRYKSMADLKESFWFAPPEEIIKSLDTTENGLSTEEAKKRLQIYGINSIAASKSKSTFSLLISQFKSPIIIILFSATLLSFLLHDALDALIILTIIIISGLLSFWQEYSANNAISKLLALVEVKVTVLRDNTPIQVKVEEIVPGDIILLKAGSLIPGDSIILDSNSLTVNEAILTGESFPAEKSPGIVSPDTPLAQRKNCLWMGTHVISGTGKALIVTTGKSTQFGSISERLKIKPKETEFERGINQFGYFLIELTLLLVIFIFAVNVLLERPALDSFLFSLALAVGLTPQLLPAIISVNLSYGAKKMAEAKVVVKRLASIENFGSMDVLCSDKTGTLTQGEIQLQAGVDANGKPSEKVLMYAYINAFFESGFVNPIDQAIRNYKEFDVKDYEKIDEHPYDFIRKRLSIMVSKQGSDGSLMVTKGAVSNILEICTKAELETGEIVDISTILPNIQQLYENYSNSGYRVLGIAYKKIDAKSTIEDEKEEDMIFLGFLTFTDPLKPGIIETITNLKNLGVSLKIVTGDNRYIAANIVKQLGINNAEILTGPEIHKMTNGALTQRSSSVSIFAEVEPNEKERIIESLKNAGHVVGYMGDGINDVSALHTADVSLSVDSAVDVAKEVADIVLLEKNLNVLADGIMAGRNTFANTLKYVFMATSANFGNMFSMAGASLFLPFLPLLPKQVLLTNLLTDFPEMTIATDSVDAEMIEKPRRWDIGFIRKFMLTFGLLSSVFDYLTFGSLLLLIRADDVQFRTGWFVESVISAALIVLVVRSRRPFYKSKPGKYLLIATFAVATATVAIPYSPLGGILGFEPLKIHTLLLIAAIIFIYIISAETIKFQFYKRIKY